MHPRNIYNQAPSFQQLAKEHPPLKDHLIRMPQGDTTIDFRNPASQRCLNDALLQRDFGLRINTPEDRLCPAIPNRLNYLLWIQDILDATSDDVLDTPVKGVDVGTGSTAIYPLLGCKMKPNWCFVGTELDPKSRACASSNVAANAMEDRVKIVEASGGGPLLGPLSASADSRFDFTMCNPPFYTSTEDVLRSAEGKELDPSGVCTGAEVEMITEGGEVGFVSKMIFESLSHPLACKWYTSMAGKLSSLTSIITLLREHKIDNYGITEFVQGQTRRWAVAWSFYDKRLPDELGRIPGTLNSAIQGLLPSRGTLTQSLKANTEAANHLATRLSEILGAIEDISQRPYGILDTVWSQISEGNRRIIVSPTLVDASEDTWSRNARRRRMTQRTSPGAPSSGSAFTAQSSTHEVVPALQILITLTTTEKVLDGARETEGRRGSGEVLLECRWMRGRDPALFETFFSHVARKLLASKIV